MSEILGACALMGAFITGALVSNLCDAVKRRRMLQEERRKAREIEEEALYVLAAQEHYAAEQAAKMAEARQHITPAFEY